MFALLRSGRSTLQVHRTVMTRGQISLAVRHFQSNNNADSGNRYGTERRFIDFLRDKDDSETKGRWGAPPSIPLKKSTVPYTFQRLSFKPQEVHVQPKEASKWREENAITVEGTTQCPPPLLEFSQTPFHPKVIELLSKTYSSPLPIQAQGWPIALSGLDMVGCADTGCGKTLAFVLPALEHIKQNRDAQHCSVLVLAPSRELAQQIEGEFHKFSKLYGFNTACVFGGQGNRQFQMRQLHRLPQVIVACPGRLLDFCNSGLVNLSQVHFLVLDEADRMLEMGFEEQLRDILQLCPPERQLTMWTATWPKAVQSLVKDYFKNGHVRVNLGSQELSANPNVSQHVVVMEPEGRIQMLFTLLEKYQGKVLVFTNAKTSAENLEFHLLREGYRDVTALHGDKTQPQRNAIIEDFKSGILRVVIATDVASRGLDVKDVELVINFEMPLHIEAYIHRIGRTARAGKKGDAYTFFTPEDAKIAKDLIAVIREAGQTPPPDLLALVNDKRGRDIRARFSNEANARGSDVKSNPYGRKGDSLQASRPSNSGSPRTGSSWLDPSTRGGSFMDRSSSRGSGSFSSSSRGSSNFSFGGESSSPKKSGGRKGGWDDEDDEMLFDLPSKGSKGQKKDNWGW